MTEHFERRRLKDKIVDNISKAIKQIQHLHVKRPECVVLTNEDPEFEKLVEQLDHAMLHGLKKLMTGYWGLVKEFTPKAVVDEVEHMNLVTTPLGKGRAWLYTALQESMLESYLRLLLENPKRVLRYYHGDALLLDQGLMHILLTLVTGLENFPFNLQPNVAYLDLASNSDTQAPSIVEEMEDIHESSSIFSLHSSLSDILKPMRTGIPPAAVDDAVDVASLPDPESSCLPNNPSPWLRHSRSSDLNHSDGTDVEVIRQKIRLSKHKRTSVSSGEGRRRKGKTPRSDTSSITSADSSCREQSDSKTRDSKTRDSKTRDSKTQDSRTLDSCSYSPVPEPGYSQGLCNGLTNHLSLEQEQEKEELLTSTLKAEDFLETPAVIESSQSHEVKSRKTSDSTLDLMSGRHEESNNLLMPKHMMSSMEWLADIINQNKTEDEEAARIRAIIEKNKGFVLPAENGATDFNCHKFSPEQLDNSSASTERSRLAFHQSQSYSECITQGLTQPHPVDGSGLIQGDQTTALVQEDQPGLARQQGQPDQPGLESFSSVESVESMDMTSSALSLSSSASDLRLLPTQDHSFTLDNNIILVISLDFFQFNSERFLKAYQTSMGHSEGTVVPLYVILSDRALYLLFHNPLATHGLKCDGVVTYKEIDYVSLSIDHQIINIVCINRRKQFWLSVGNQLLTKSLVNELDRAVRQCVDAVPLLSLLSDATTQKIALKKWLAEHYQCQKSEVNILRYSLVHWQASKEPSPDWPKPPDVLQATLLYLPFSHKPRHGQHNNRARDNGRHPLHSNRVQGAWRPVYCVLRDGQLKIYMNRASVEEKPILSIYLSPDTCIGCRFCRQTPQPHTLELLLEEQCGIMLSCETAQQCQEWLQGLCYWVHHLSQLENSRSKQESTPCCAVLTPDKLIVCQEDVQTHFVRMLASLSLIDLSQLMIDPNDKRYCILCIDTPHAPCPEQWTLYFNTCHEMDTMSTTIRSAWQQLFKVDLPVVDITDRFMRQKNQNILTDMQQLFTVFPEHTDRHAATMHSSSRLNPLTTFTS